MAKYYVQCGPLQVVLVADTVRQATIAAIDKSLRVHAWIYDDAELSNQDCRDHLMIEALLHLDPTMQVSEKGFGRTDAMLVGTPEAIEAWHNLMVGMNRLFIAAGLAPRTMASIAGKVIEDDFPRCKLPR
ncbi:MAG: hypothetical protein WBD31_23335 [Rubripirellula sp.]